MAKRQRMRVDPKRVADDARSKAGGGESWFVLPSNVREFAVDKAGNVLLDILPFEVKTKHHPDNVEPGTLWYKMPFQVHFSVGVESKAIVCPVSIGRPCPMCEDRTVLARDREGNAKAMQALRTQRWVAYNVFDPDDSDKIAIFAMSRGKFAEPLEQELLEGDEANLNFFDVTDDGRTLRVRFSEDQYQGKKFYKATRIDFKPRGVLDEDAILADTIALDDVLRVLTYDQVVKMYRHEADDHDSTGRDDEPAATSKPTTGTGAAASGGGSGGKYGNRGATSESKPVDDAAPEGDDEPAPLSDDEVPW